MALGRTLKGMADMRWLMGYTAAVCVLALIICTSIAFPSFYRPFFSYQYDKLNVMETIETDKETLMEMTEVLLSYMRGRRESLDATAVVAGQEREFYSQREKDHMVDVLELYNLLFTVRNLTFWLFLFMLTGMALFKYDIGFLLSRCCREVLAGFLILIVILAGVIALDFDRAFTVFHLLFFSNDLWILNPSVDLLINMVPLPFFIDISVFIGIMVLVKSALVIGLSTWYLKRTAFLSRR
jgi:integral membrane protein (TIGR01906 family)